VKLRDYARQWETFQESRKPFAVLVLAVMAHLITRGTRRQAHARYAATVKLICPRQSQRQ